MPENGEAVGKRGRLQRARDISGWGIGCASVRLLKRRKLLRVQVGAGVLLIRTPRMRAVLGRMQRGRAEVRVVQKDGSEEVTQAHFLGWLLGCFGLEDLGKVGVISNA